MKSRKVAILHPKFSGIGGAENLVASCSEVLTKNNWSVDLFTGEYQRGLWPALDKLSVHQMSGRRILRSKYFDAIRFGSQFAEKLGEYDLIWAHNYPATLWAQKALKKFPQAKGVWYCNEPRRNLYPEITEHHLIEIDRYVSPSKRKNNQRYYEMREELLAAKNSLRNRRDRAWEKRVLKDFDFVQTVSEYAAHLARQIFDVRAECCYAPVLTPPIDIHAMHDSQPWTVGCIATFAERKNFLNVYRALEIVHRRNFNIKIRIGVASPQRLHEFLKSHGIAISSHFEVVDTFKTDDLHAFYQSLDLNLYLTIDEPLGLIPIEAALSGAPSLLSDHAGPEELAQLGFGTTVNPFDDDQIADAVLKRFATRLDANGKMGLQRLAENHFGVESFLTRFTNQIKDL